MQNAAQCIRNNSCALSAALSVALSLEATPSKVIEAAIDFTSDLLCDVLPLSQLVSGKAAAGAAAAASGGAMHMLAGHCDASCLGNTLENGSQMLALAQHLHDATWLADSISGIADDAIGGQVLKLAAAAGVAYAIRRAVEPVSPRSQAAAQREAAKAVQPLATTLALGMVAADSPAAAQALMALQQPSDVPLSPKAVAAAATEAAATVVKDVTNWPLVIKKRAEKAVSELHQGRLSLMGVLVALDIAAVAHNASDVAQVVQQVAGQ